MEPSEEITAEIDPGKTLEIRLQAVGETHEDGEVRVFFELNGQPRVIRDPDRLIKSATAWRPKAAAGNDKHMYNRAVKLTPKTCWLNSSRCRPYRLDLGRQS